MSTSWKIVIGVACIIVGVTLQLRSRATKEAPAGAVNASLRGAPIQSTQTSNTPAQSSESPKVVQATPASQPVTSNAPASKPNAPENEKAVGSLALSGTSSSLTQAVAAVANGFLNVGFEKLATFNYVVPDETPGATNVTAALPDQIPGNVRAFDQKLISLKGYMLPLKVEAGLVTELLIMKDQSMCCFGSVPKINEWVSVKMTGRGVKAVMDQPVTLFGKLYVGEIRENGYLVGIYRMDGERLGEQEGL